MTNRGLVVAIQERFGLTVSFSTVTNLRRNYAVPMDVATRRKAYNKRQSGAAAPVPLDEEAKTLQEVRAAHRKTLLRLEAIKLKKEELVHAVFEAAKEAASSLDLPPVKPFAIQKSKTNGTPETAIVVFGDWQLAKVTPSYNSEVCKERIARYVDKAIRLTQLQRADHPVKHLSIYMVGDLIEGEQVFPGQSFLIDASLFRQVLVSGPEILGDAIRQLSSHFEHTDIDGVIGNHGCVGGRARKEYHPETNADTMMYEATRLFLRNEPSERVAWAPNMVPGERKWYSVPRVGKKGFLLFHGDQKVKGGMLGYPWYGMGKKILGWHAGAIREKFDYAISGHFHTPARNLYGPIRHWGSGSTESDNTFAAENLAAMGSPSQWLLFCHPDHGITAEYEVHLEKGDYE